MGKYTRAFYPLLWAGCVALFLAGAANADTAQATETVYLFISFRGDGDWLHLAVSDDGYRWTQIDGAFLTPMVGSRLMRDPHVLLGSDGLFHMVWTTGWNDKGIGHASSRDLVNWSDRRYLPLMEQTPGTRNCWAPETFYDAARREYIITWSSDVEGRFPQTAWADRMNNRTYYVRTKDFETFSPPALLFDPGFDPEGVRRITPSGYNEGAFVIERKGAYYLMWSEYDTRDPRYSVRYVTSDSPSRTAPATNEKPASPPCDSTPTARFRR